MTERQRTAYHEAAHALVASELGIAVYVTIIACATQRANGITRHLALTSEVDPDALLSVTVAAIVSERLLGLSLLDGSCDTDMDSAHRVLRELAGVDPESTEGDARLAAALAKAGQILVAGQSRMKTIAEALLTHDVIHLTADGTITPEAPGFARDVLVRNLYK